MQAQFLSVKTRDIRVAFMRDCIELTARGRAAGPVEISNTISKRFLLTILSNRDGDGNVSAVPGTTGDGTVPCATFSSIDVTEVTWFPKLPRENHLFGAILAFIWKSSSDREVKFITTGDLPIPYSEARDRHGDSRSRQARLQRNRVLRTP
jgi:hypothetical protein